MKVMAVVLDISMVEKWEGDAVGQELRLLRFIPCRGRKVKSILRTIRKERAGKRMAVMPKGRRGRLFVLQSKEEWSDMTGMECLSFPGGL